MTLLIAKPTSRAKIRLLTNELREIVDMSSEKYFPVVEFLEWGLPQFDPKFTLEIVTPSSMNNEYGVTYPEKKLIRLREDVYEKAANGSFRDRFTIAHEIGHYFMHSPEKIAFARSQVKDEVPAFKDPEWQANTFAGELLAPPQVIKGLSIKEVSICCGVSLDVARIQLRNV